MHSTAMLFPSLLLWIGGANALPWDGVKPTKYVDFSTYNPEPPQTTATVADLRKRQQPGDFTCGYAYGISSYAEYCINSRVCATNSVGAFGCCESASLDNCPLFTTCIDRTALSRYDSTFLAKPDVGFCGDATAAYCVTKFFEYDRVVTGWDCSSSRDTETFYTTIANGITTSAISVYNAVYIPSAPTTSSLSSTTTSPISTTSSSITMPIPTPTPEPAAAAPAPIGAIVGGTVGGVAVIGGLALLAFFLFRRSRQQKNAQAMHPEADKTDQSPGPAQPPPFTHYPDQPGYGHAGQSAAQSPLTTGTMPYPEKSPVQNTLPVPGSPEIMSPVSTGGGDQRASTIAPPYSPTMSELGAPVRTVHELS